MNPQHGHPSSISSSGTLQLLNVWSQEFIEKLIEEELTLQSSPLPKQTAQQELLRNSSVGKIVKWTQKLDLNNNALHSAVSIMDNYLIQQLKQNQSFASEQYSLLAVSCMFLSRKILRGKFVEISKFLQLIGEEITFQKQNILLFQQTVLQKLDYEVIKTTSLDFLGSLLLTIQKPTEFQVKLRLVPKKCEFLSAFILELMLINQNKYYQNFPNALLAVCSLKLSCHFFSKQHCPAIEKLIKRIGYSEQQVQICSEILFGTLIRAGKQSFYGAIYEKYSAQKYLKVAQMKFISIAKESSNKVKVSAPKNTSKTELKTIQSQKNYIYA